MKVDIEQAALAALDDDGLFLAAVQPIAVWMHSGENKYRVYEGLSEGQRGAFMLWVLVSHAGDVQQFYTWLPYMRSPETAYWPQLVAGAKRMGLAEVSAFLAACDSEFSKLEQEKQSWAEFRPEDLENAPLYARINALYERWTALSPVAMRHAGACIRQNIDAFFKLAT